MFDTVTIELPEMVSSRTAVTQTPLNGLRPHPQLRLGELDQDHLSVISLSEQDWPPIVVRRADNTIIDGHYRYVAARRLGHRRIACVYFDGGDEAAFLEALRRNRSHGLPLSLQERQRAARRLLESHPDWSHRRIAELCCLAPGTVARIRTAAPPSPAIQEAEPAATRQRRTKTTIQARRSTRPDTTSPRDPARSVATRDRPSNRNLPGHRQSHKIQTRRDIQPPRATNHLSRAIRMPHPLGTRLGPALHHRGKRLCRLVRANPHRRRIDELFPGHPDEQDLRDRRRSSAPSLRLDHLRIATREPSQSPHQAVPRLKGRRRNDSSNSL